LDCKVFLQHFFQAYLNYIALKLLLNKRLITIRLPQIPRTGIQIGTLPHYVRCKILSVIYST